MTPTPDTALAPGAQSLLTQPHFFEPGRQHRHPYEPGDAFYEALIDAHRDLSDEQSALLDARVLLLLANHIGNLQVLRQALAAARAGL